MHSYSWTIPLFTKGLKCELEEEDLFYPSEQSESSVLGKKLEMIWEEELTRFNKPSLWRALIRCFGLEFITLSVIWFFIECLRLVKCYYTLRAYSNKILFYFSEYHKQWL